MLALPSYAGQHSRYATGAGVPAPQPAQDVDRPGGAVQVGPSLFRV
jgi:hypothetical protein